MRQWRREFVKVINIFNRPGGPGEWQQSVRRNKMEIIGELNQMTTRSGRTYDTRSRQGGGALIGGAAVRTLDVG